MTAVTNTPLLIAMAGLPGTGKSVLADQLGKRLHAIVLNKDRIRTQLFSREEVDYSREQDDFCIRVIFLMAEYILRAKPEQPIVIDGRTFSRSYQVEELLAQAASLNARPVILECVCDEKIVKQRIEKDRETESHPAGNRTWQLYLDLKEKAQPITCDHTVIDTGKESLEKSVERCVRAIEALRAGG